MIRKWFAALGVIVTMLLPLCLSTRTAAARGQAAGQQAAQPAYTPAEYNAYIAAQKTTDPQQRLTMLTDFLAKYPNSSLLSYVYVLEYQTYAQTKNYPQTLAYVDKLLAMGDKIDGTTSLTAYVARAQAFYLGYSGNDKTLTAPDQLTAARDAAGKGQAALDAFKKPDGATDEQFAQQKKSLTILFNTIAGITSTQLKDYKAAATAFTAALAADPTDALSDYRLGIAELQEEPPLAADGFWALARSISLKAPGEAQIRDYFQKKLSNYQQTQCDDLIKKQMDEMIQLAAAAPQRPATYTIPSAADLDKVRQQTTYLTVLADLKAGGDKAKLTWLTVCGSDFPEVAGKILDVTPGTDFVEMKVFAGATSEEMQAAIAANMDVRIVGQPEATRLQKEDGVRFSGTLVAYDPEPLMLHWDKAKVNAEDIPSEKAEPGKHHHIPKKPGR
jgi:hypothetical protein